MKIILLFNDSMIGAEMDTSTCSYTRIYVIVSWNCLQLLMQKLLIYFRRIVKSVFFRNQWSKKKKNSSRIEKSDVDRPKSHDYVLAINVYSAGRGKHACNYIKDVTRKKKRKERFLSKQSSWEWTASCRFPFIRSFYLKF